MIETKGIVHITLPVSDVQRSERFYCDILGMKVIQRVPAVGMSFLKSGAGEDIVILCRQKAPIVTNPDKTIFIHTAFRVDVDKYDAAVADLRAKGVTIIHEEDRNEGVFHGRQAYFHDPDRNVLELIGLKKIDAGLGVGEPFS